MKVFRSSMAVMLGLAMASLASEARSQSTRVTSTPLEGGGKSFVGTANKDSISGTNFDDIIAGNAGDDSLRGYAGNDVIDGGDGRDNIDAGDGNDTVSDGNGDDTVRLGRGNDMYVGSPGSDKVLSDFVPTRGVIEVDTADYSAFTTSVAFEIRDTSALIFTTTETGVLERDSLSRFDVYFGTAHNDLFKISGSSRNLPDMGPPSYTVYGGEGADTFVVSRFLDTPLKVVTSSGTTFVPVLPAVVADFIPLEDKIMFNAESFAGTALVNDEVFEGTTDLGENVFAGVDEEGNELFEFIEVDLLLQNVARSDDGLLLDAQEGNNVYVLQGSFESVDAAAVTLAMSLSTGPIDDGVGFGVYFDSTEGRIRVFSTTDLDSLDGEPTVIGNFENDLGELNVELLPLLTEEDFAIVDSAFGF